MRLWKRDGLSRVSETERDLSVVGFDAVILFIMPTQSGGGERAYSIGKWET